MTNVSALQQIRETLSALVDLVAAEGDIRRLPELPNALEDASAALDDAREVRALKDSIKSLYSGTVGTFTDYAINNPSEEVRRRRGQQLADLRARLYSLYQQL